MRWIAISGSWRKHSKELEKDVRKTINDILSEGNGIVSGGALGVDYIALDEALRNDPKAEKIKVFIPTTLEKFSEHYKKHALLRNITVRQAERIIKQLNSLKKINPKALIENPDVNFTEETKKRMYYERNSKVIDASEELVAFHVNNTYGTQDAIDKAGEKGIPTTVLNYQIK